MPYACNTYRFLIPPIKMRYYQKYFIPFMILLIISFCCSTCSIPIENSFKEITGEDLPKDAKIKIIEDSHTDLHGDYGRILVVKVGSEYYDSLPIKLIQKGFKSEIEDPIINEFKEVNNYIKLPDIISRFKYIDNSVYHFVGFYSDKETIVLIRSSW